MNFIPLVSLFHTMVGTWLCHHNAYGKGIIMREVGARRSVKKILDVKIRSRVIVVVETVF